MTHQLRHQSLSTC